MEMELDLFFVDGVLLVALMALGASLGHFIGGLARHRCPALFRIAARFERRHPGLFDQGDFYCFFRKGALYGS
ncbi:hypothetical protein JCM14722_13890 [Pseudodesulfovibrio portus]|uniref:Uncharacterized protein n=2 Tax=Pseudodesulfovibrio portus TaxID=231439 RepID=A0ABN6RW80_9BACT|nr:hypothetical protein JCM14722_13890 [Pseudodesulfovibrio portus]